ncbi:XRE family transcriptional regulator [Arcicella rigui]|uniref:Helix-turn-helix domain-containing protein n=1 Tax=Arcicella rigui TaxID=797020 RepID=A0ABU5QD41_9BACT|nr:helix-turn-helix domain-containing protein [Arcicella rigui]MEA5140533.1 helix-turn-helix domain-containing protein [Arcicella rigui]
MDTFFSQNLQFLRKSLEGKVSQEKMADELMIKKSTLGSYESGRAEPRYGDLVKLSAYFKVSIDELLKEDLSIKPAFPKQEEKLRILTTTVSPDNEDNIEYVPIKAVAGYVNGYGDLEYISNLPVFNVPFLAKDKKYRVFPIQGDSMLPLKEGSLVFAEYIENWKTVRDGTVCVVVTRSEGIVLKKVFNYLTEMNVLVLKSTNEHYAPYPVLGDDVQELWRFVGYYSSVFPV